MEIADSRLRAVEEEVLRALETGDYRGLDVLGFGEVSLVLRVADGEQTFACKRLPSFPDSERLERYRSLLSEYLRTLRSCGMQVCETELRWWPNAAGSITAYCVQRAFPPGSLFSDVLRACDERSALEFFEQFLDLMRASVSESVGVDAQASNFAESGGKLVFLDVTTPFMRDGRGRERLDTKLFVTSLPWFLRHAVPVLLRGSIFDKYYSLRGVVLDFLGNLHKERAARLIPAFLQLANAHLTKPLTRKEVDAYYAGDARMWTLLQWLRKADRWWQRHIRRRSYAILLPPAASR
jgi:hypothetical protein